MMSRVITLMFYQTALGSSPRVWGQVTSYSSASCPMGIIPTRVGTRALCGVSRIHAWDHPHACGDKRAVPRTRKTRIGSSPRVWGQAKIRSLNSLRSRIIPTRVGTRSVILLIFFNIQDHPHACGDKHHLPCPAVVLLGSSPRVWGQAAFIRVHFTFSRIIPTRVGTRPCAAETQTVL